MMPATAEMAMKMMGFHFSFRMPMKMSTARISAFQMKNSPRPAPFERASILTRAMRTTLRPATEIMAMEAGRRP